MGTFSDIDWDLSDSIERAVAAGLIDDAASAYSVARQVAERGLSSLTPKQRSIYQRRVLPALDQLAKVRTDREMPVAPRYQPRP